jgi:hypothetical protein
VQVSRWGPTRSTVALVTIIGALFLVTALATSHISDGQSSADITATWAEQMIAAWQPTKYSPMSFGAMMVPASYDEIDFSQNTPAVLQGYLNMLESSGTGYLRIDVGFDAWLSGRTGEQQEIVSLVNQSRQDGKGFILADASAEAYRGFGHGLPWSQFKKAWVERVTTLASVLHPDYYVVVKEPGWYAPMISDVLTNPLAQSPTDWLGLTQNLTNAVHSVSPDTKVGVAIAADSLNQNPTFYNAYLKGLSKLSGLSFMGFDIYTTTGFTATQSFLSKNGSGGLAVWIAECWSATDAATAYDASRSTLDPKWMLATYYFAQRENVSMMVPFFTNTFAAYNLTETSPTDQSQILGLLQQRTPVFHMFQNITAGLENIPAGTTSSGSSTSATSPSTTSTGTTSTGNSSTKPSSGSQAGRFPVTLIGVAAVVLVVVVLVGIALTRKRK